MSRARRLALAGALLAPALAHAARPLTTDRPDATESPFTVEPGRYQLEASLVAWARDEHTPERDGARVTAWSVAPTNLRIGLAPGWELQVVSDNYLEVEVRTPDGRTVRERGFGDVTLRVKHNFFGNDDGTTALGVMPFVKLPTAADALGNGEVEGGVIVPLATELPGGWGFGAMIEVDVVRDAEDDGYDLVWINTATVSHDLTERAGVFFELASTVGAGAHALAFNTGLTFAINDDVQLDAGVNLGLTRAAEDVAAFTGFAIRF